MVFSAFVITLFASQEAGFLGGSSIPKILKPFPVPGVLVGYCVAMATGSDILAWTGFALGVILFYGIVGVILDVLLRVSMKRIDGREEERTRKWDRYD
ncbi:MAG TPA: hypothetical protein DD670_17745 [Planctomycetaceae bacterium]|nr:hypothetical protein [Planctomycetaceae bacterium]